MPLNAQVDAQNKTDIRSIAKEYFETYKLRQDFPAFLEYYDQKIILEDMVGGYRVQGKDMFAKFFDWHSVNFELIETVAMEIEEIIIERNVAVAKGYFTPFRWNNKRVEAMQFTSILTFNDNGKIIKQVDWINYPEALLDYQNRVNSNEWIEYSR